MLLGASSACMAADGNASPVQEPPGIFIERIVDESQAIIPLLKVHYGVCTNQKTMAQQARQMGGEYWNGAKASLPPGYAVSGQPYPEPDWKKEGVGIHRELEYFHGEKYALYKYRTDYRFSEDGRCSLVKQEILSIEMDNARDRYKITLKDRIPSSAAPGAGSTPLSHRYRYKKIHRTKSPILGRKQNDALLEEFRGNRELARLFAKLLSDTEANRAPGAPGTTAHLTPEKIQDAFQLSEQKYTRAESPRANYENIVSGQACDIVESKTLRGRVWYWQPMHIYPNVMERPIILKSEATPFGKQLGATSEAIRFIVNEGFSDSVFEPDAEMLKQSNPRSGKASP